MQVNKKNKIIAIEKKISGYIRQTKKEKQRTGLLFVVRVYSKQNQIEMSLLYRYPKPLI